VTPDRHGSAVIEFPNDLDVLITREFDAPIALVFDVLTKPEQRRCAGSRQVETSVRGVRAEVSVREAAWLGSAGRRQGAQRCAGCVRALARGRAGTAE
jgi:uncharacterized protein YndB with AHSA1/START domain